MWRLFRTNARFRRLFFAQAVTNFGETAVYLSLAIWIKELTGSNTETGLVFLAMTAPGLASPLLGHLVDRVARKPLMLRMFAVMAVLFLALFAVRGAGQIWIIYAVTVAYGLVSATPFWPALLKDFLPSQDAAPARSLLMAAGQGVRIVSPAVGAAVFVAFGGHGLAAMGCATFLLGIVLMASIEIVESEPEPADEPFRTSVVAGFRFIPRVPLLLRHTLAAGAFMAVVGLLETAVFAAIGDGLHRSASFFGVVASFQGAGSVVGGLLAAWVLEKFRETWAAIVGYVLMGAGLLVCLLPEAPLFLAGTVLFGLGMPYVLIALGTAFHLYTPSRMQGRANAALNTVMGALQTASIAVGAALVGVLGFRVMYLAMAATGVLCAVALLPGRNNRPEVEKSVADEEEDEDGLGEQAAAVAEFAAEPEPERRSERASEPASDPGPAPTPEPVAVADEAHR